VMPVSPLVPKQREADQTEHRLGGVDEQLIGSGEIVGHAAGAASGRERVGRAGAPYERTGMSVLLGQRMRLPSKTILPSTMVVFTRPRSSWPCQGLLADLLKPALAS